VDNEI